MPEAPSAPASELQKLARLEDLEAFETLWLQLIDDESQSIETFMAGVDALEGRGRGNRAGLYLGMLFPKLMERGEYAAAIDSMQRVARLSPREVGLRENLLKAYRAHYGKHPHFEALLAKADLENDADVSAAAKRIRTYLSFDIGDYVYHRAGWGTGRVVSLDPDALTVSIDFESKEGEHAMGIEMARKVTEVIDANDLRALAFDRLEELERMRDEDPVELVRATLRSRRRDAVLRDVRAKLTESLIDAKAWTKWWQKARTLVKKAPDIVMGPGTNPSIELRVDGGGLAESCLRDLKQIRGGPKRVKYFRDLLREREGGKDREDAIAGVAAALMGSDRTGRDLELGSRISLAFLLRDARQVATDIPEVEALEPENVVKEADKVVAALPQVPIAGHRLLALGIIKGNAEDWPQLYEEVLFAGEPDSAEHALNELVGQGHAERAARALQTIIERYRENAPGFVWYLKLAIAKKLPEGMPCLDDGTLLEKALVLHSDLELPRGRQERNEAASRKLARSIATVLLSRNLTFITRCFENVEIEAARNLETLIRRNRSLGQDTTDKIMAAMFRARPELGRLRAAEQAARDADKGGFEIGQAIFCTSVSIARKRTEVENIENHQIPQAAKEKNIAAGYGDLSENSEYSAAIEKLDQLSERLRRLRAELNRCRPIDSSLRDSELVFLGARVDVKGDEGPLTYTLLGPWDVDLRRNYISYESPIGKALLNRKVGDVVSFDIRGGSKQLTITAIEDGLSAAEDALEQDPPKGV
jgi:transcription elongation factor GreA